MQSYFTSCQAASRPADWLVATCSQLDTRHKGGHRRGCNRRLPQPELNQHRHLGQSGQQASKPRTEFELITAGQWAKQLSTGQGERTLVNTKKQLWNSKVTSLSLLQSESTLLRHKFEPCLVDITQPAPDRSASHCPPIMQSVSLPRGYRIGFRTHCNACNGTARGSDSNGDTVVTPMRINWRAVLSCSFGQRSGF